jgi:hypothetical protein
VQSSESGSGVGDGKPSSERYASRQDDVLPLQYKLYDLPPNATIASIERLSALPHEVSDRRDGQTTRRRQRIAMGKGNSGSSSVRRSRDARTGEYWHILATPDALLSTVM